ncbi:lecithin--cholesterol acyltransferase [Nostoc sp. LPT]|uniref:lipase/acyltransferase domain-containing protein n=1 Tax=Nostoc sp. LPT TaxID=2815387 RepID=UPI001D401707|nr:lecithin--cholesterol acyltransferase [Nostoc sp. LPT]MBN4005430.1 lecithin--cholesterol acyltransferase [Nostoc sp. LPT]
MANKIPIGDMVVVLPGIMGSVLQKDGIDLWNFSGQALVQVIKTFGKRVKDLKLKGDDPHGGDIGDGIKATSLIKDSYMFPVFGGFGKIVDGYNRISAQITNNFDEVHQGNIYDDPEDKAANFYHFPYDWRRDNRANANILKKLLDKRLKRWREYSGNNDAKVILVAHSMGGLISRYYLEVLGGWQDCKALFTFGTPYRGSINAVNILANGFKIGGINLVEVMQLKEVIPSLTSIYQLLPRYKALKIGNDFYRIAGKDGSPVDLPNIDRIKATDAFNFHEEIDNAADANYKNSTYLRSFVTCPIVGVNQPTMQSAELKNGVISLGTDLPTFLQDRLHLGDGDGTVPQVSATPVQMNDREILSIVDYIAESHGAIQNQPNILLNLIKGIQTAQTPSSEDVRGALQIVARGKRSGLKGIGLSLEDLYSIKEPITMRAKVTGNASFNSLTAEITCVSHERPATIRNFTAENGNWILATDDLEVGLYRVKVQTDNTSEDAPNPVHNLFEVADLGE